MAFVNYPGGRFVLKRNESATVKMGPFLNSDGDVVTGLTINQSDVQLSKNDAAFAQKNDSSAATDLGNGWYDVSLNNNDANTQGNLLIFINVSGCLPVWRYIEVDASSEPL